LFTPEISLLRFAASFHRIILLIVPNHSLTEDFLYYQWVVSENPAREDLRSLNLGTNHWTEAQIVSSSTVLVKEKERIDSRKHHKTGW
jgi:hypothetical protein